MFSIVYSVSIVCTVNGATAAADTNVPERLFKSHGRWKIDYSSGSIQEQIKSFK